MKKLLIGLLVMGSFSAFADTLIGEVIQKTNINTTINGRVTQKLALLKLDNGEELNLCFSFPNINVGRKITCHSSRFEVLIGKRIEVEGTVQKTKPRLRGESDKDIVTILYPETLADKITVLDPQSEISGKVIKIRNGFLRKASYTIAGVTIKEGLFNDLRSLKNKSCNVSGDLNNDVIVIHKAQCN